MGGPLRLDVTSSATFTHDLDLFLKATNEAVIHCVGSSRECCGLQCSPGEHCVSSHACEAGALAVWQPHRRSERMGSLPEDMTFWTSRLRCVFRLLARCAPSRKCSTVSAARSDANGPCGIHHS